MLGSLDLWQDVSTYVLVYRTCRGFLIIYGNTHTEKSLEIFTIYMMHLLGVTYSSFVLTIN